MSVSHHSLWQDALLLSGAVLLQQSDDIAVIFAPRGFEWGGAVFGPRINVRTIGDQHLYHPGMPLVGRQQ